MMLPFLSEVQNTSKKYNVSFRGINYGEGAQDGEFADTHNLSTDKYPCITQRAARIKKGQYTAPSTLHAKGKLLLIDETKVLYGNKEVGTVKAGKKQTATIGNYIVIFPDKKYYKVPTDDDSDGEFGSMEETYTATGLVFTDSTITTTGDDFKFREGDAVKITGCSKAENNQTIIIDSVSGKALTFYENSFAAGTESGEVTIKREIPDLDFICESNYRLWGTHGNKIYGSKFSDPLNFAVLDGLADNSYEIEVGSEGEFTGCIPYSSHICFFKENTVHKLYGTKPSNFQIHTANVYGVQKGSERSMHIVNEQLLYKGVGGIYSYTGGVPELLSEKLGNKRYSDAVACCDGETYYISMKQGDNYSLFAYDVAKNIWLREDDTHAVDMAFYDGSVHYVDSEGGLYYIDKTADRTDIEWGATFATMHETINERKGYSKFHLRMDLSAGAWLALDIKTDNDPQWRQVYTTHNEKAKTVSIPIMPTRCDSIDIRLRGGGECTIKSFSREFTVGSDV
ncbi:MAG: hypothetical protein J6S71_00695 [Clostridia bacterium]|nr:hypothetical protein [Clostridia bacterium]